MCIRDRAELSPEDKDKANQERREKRRMDKENLARRAAKPEAIKKRKSKEVSTAQGQERQVKARAAKTRARANILAVSREAAAQAQAMGRVRPPERLVAMFNNGGADLSTATRRLSTTKNCGDAGAHQQAVQDAEAVVKANSHLGLEDFARNVRAYYERSRLSKYVCGTCGARDTDDHYIKKVKLTDLSKDHWLRVDDIAFERLRNSKWMRLAKPNLEDDTYTYVDVQVKDLHTFAEIEGDNGGAFHVVPEAVLPEGHIRVCRACAHTWKNEPAQRCSRNQDSAVDTFNDLYSKNAPRGSIAAGDDYGRLNIMSSKGIRVDYSTVELALGSSRRGAVLSRSHSSSSVRSRKA